MTVATTPADGTPSVDQTTPEAGSPTGQTPTDNGAQTAPQNPDDSRPALDTLPKYWQDHIKDLRGENKTYRTSAEQAQRDQADKEAKDLEQRQEWEKLASKRQQEVERLTPIASEAERLGELIKSQIDAEITKWPKEVADTHPEGEVSAVTMYEWFTKMRPLAQRLMQVDEEGTTTQPKPGNRSGPPPRTQSTNNQDSAPAASEPLVNIDRRF